MKAKQLLLTALVLLLTTGCNKDGNPKTTQDVWLNGYEAETSLSDYELAPITIMFFKEDVLLNFTPKTYPSNAQNLYDYTKVPEDGVYSALIDHNKLLLNDGTFISPVETYHTSALPKNQPQLTAKLPFGKYLVVALYSYRDTRRVFWNKYACTEYQVYERYNPLDLTVVIPADLTQYGCISWVNWSDKMYDF